MRLRPTQPQAAAIVSDMVARVLATTANIPVESLPTCRQGLFFSIPIKNKWMNNIINKLREFSSYVYLTLLVVALIICLLYIGEMQRIGWISSIQLLSAFLGAAIVAAVTFILLKGQAKNQNAVQQNVRIFENKLQAYESFLADLQRVVARNEVTPEDEKMLQFAVATISMHTNSAELLRISRCLKEIIQKIRTKDSVDNTMWHELMEIVYIFRHSLYADDIKKTFDSNIECAIRNFSTVTGCENKIYSLLEYVECNLSSYRRNVGISTYIEDRCLHVKIPISNKICKEKHLDSEICLSLQVADAVENRYRCRIGLYFHNDDGSMLYRVYNDEQLWTGRMPVVEDVDWKLGADTVKTVVGLGYDYRDKLSVLTIMYDLITVIYPLWARSGMIILRKRKDGNIIKEEPYKRKLNYDTREPEQ